MRCAATAVAAAALTVSWRRAAWTAGVEKSVEVLERAARGRARRPIGFERTAEIIVKGNMSRVERRGETMRMLSVELMGER